jgi:hypothetical protein
MSSVAPTPAVLKDDQTVQVVFNYVDAKGGVATPPSATPSFTSDTPAVATVAANPDGSLQITAVAEGTATVSGSVLANDGTTTITLPTIAVTVGGEGASAVAGATVGTPTQQ